MHSAPSVFIGKMPLQACNALHIVVTLFILQAEIIALRGESTGNLHILKDEIQAAMAECTDSKESRENAKIEFEKTSLGNPDSPIHPDNPLHDRSIRDTRRLNINILLESIHKYLQEKSLDEGNSGEWDYGDSDRSQSSGSSWDNPKNDKGTMDSMYSHNRRNDSSSYGNNSYGTSGNDRSVQNQNSTRYNQNNMSNNVDSRGARVSPGFQKVLEDRKYNSVRDLNLSSNYYDPFMRHSRRKRHERLIKIATDNECLSQCVFTNLQIVDDRGIPKEVLFTKLLQDSVTSQLSRDNLEAQLKTCFHELATDSEDDSCAYSNSLERCLALQLRTRLEQLHEDVLPSDGRP